MVLELIETGLSEQQRLFKLIHNDAAATDFEKNM